MSLAEVRERVEEARGPPVDCPANARTACMSAAGAGTGQELSIFELSPLPPSVTPAAAGLTRDSRRR